MERSIPSHRERAELVEGLVDAVGGVVWEFDWSTGAFTFVNGAAEQLLGYTRDEWLEPGFWVSRLYPDDADWAANYCVRATEDRRDHDFEYRMVRKDGEVIWVRDIVSVDKARGLDGRLRGLLIDITAQKAAEAEYARKAEEFDAVVRVSRDLYFRVDPDDVVRAFTAYSEDALYAPPAVFLGKRLEDVVPPQMSDRVGGCIAEARRTGAMRVMEYELPVGGSTQYWEARILPLDAGHVAAIARDVTVRTVAELAVRESEQRFRNMVEQSPFGMHFYRLEGGDLIFGGANPAADEMLGVSHRELVGRTIEEAFPGLAGTEIPDIYVRLAAEGGTWQAEDVSYEQGDIAGAFEVTAFHISDDEMAVAFRDITERKVAQHRESTYKARLSAMAADLTVTEDRERRRLAEELHDRVGQPLAVARMILAGATAAADPALAADVAKASALLEDAIREARTITTVLAPPVLYELGLAAALRWWCEDAERIYGTRISLDGAVDESGISDESKMMLFRAVRELVMNVVKHAETDEAWVVLGGDDSWLSVTVEDHGAGFDPDAATGGTGDSGFGLFSIRERLPHLGGRFEMISSPGEGTQVTLWVPRAAAPA